MKPRKNARTDNPKCRCASCSKVHRYNERVKHPTEMGTVSVCPRCGNQSYTIEEGE